MLYTFYKWHTIFLKDIYIIQFLFFIIFKIIIPAA